jgi:hypothetical protein
MPSARINPHLFRSRLATMQAGDPNIATDTAQIAALS